MEFSQTNKPDGNTEFKFQSKNITGTPLGLLAFIIPASVWLTWTLMDFLPSRTTGGVLILFQLIGSVVLSVAGYQFMKYVLFVKSHHFVVSSNRSFVIDGKSYSRKDVQGFGLRRGGTQSMIYMIKDDNELNITGWLDSESAAHIANSLMN